jgi:hypothetical protein
VSHRGGGFIYHRVELLRVAVRSVKAMVDVPAAQVLAHVVERHLGFNTIYSVEIGVLTHNIA